jgi:hypothetical protein
MIWDAMSVSRNSAHLSGDVRAAHGVKVGDELVDLTLVEDPVLRQVLC